jgi:Mrp family chromosome partitioning ATPase
MNHRTEPQLRENVATQPALQAQAQLLRSRVEAELGKPAVVMVTSARARDGKSLTAYSLAAALAKWNHRVALVSRSCEEYQQLSVVKIPGDEGNSRDRLAAFVERMRSEYDFTIIDAETFVKNSTVMALVRLVDGILLAVRIGRAPTADDQSMVGILEEFGGHVIGVVATEADTIDNFGAARLEKPAQLRHTVRPDSEQNPLRAIMAAITERALA